MIRKHDFDYTKPKSATDPSVRFRLLRAYTHDSRNLALSEHSESKGSTEDTEKIKTLFVLKPRSSL